MTAGAGPANPWALPTRRAAAAYQLRVWGLVLLRGLRELWGPAPPRHRASGRMAGAPIVAEHRSPLWRDGREDEFALVAGKVHNLRLARRAFDGVVVPAGEVFSFWRQLGRPGRGRAFVEGREVRAGCVVPTVAGGLCQLSNALATCAVGGGLALVERHAHTARVERDEGPARSDSVDATVFWNYVDLRFVAPFDYRLEVELTQDELVVRLRATDGPRPVGRPASAVAPVRVPIAAVAPVRPVARGCLTCDEADCFRHRRRTNPRPGGATAVLADVWTPEFAHHLAAVPSEADWCIPWVRPARRRSGAWVPPATARRTVAIVASLRRTLLLHRRAGEGGRRQAALLQGDRWLAECYARGLEARHTHLVIDQSLLVPLAQAGVLGGRTYEVLVRALPAGELQRRLDAAALRRPDAASLTDFRVSDARAAIEVEALRRARRLVTPHADVARHLREACAGTPVEILDWHLRPPRTHRPARVPGAVPVVAFAASALARKGSLEMAEAMRRLGWRLMVLGTPAADARTWHGIDVVPATWRDPSWLARADVVALPAFVEHAPRALLDAIAQGIPVVASPACGLPPALGAIEVPAGDTEALVHALRQALASSRRALAAPPKEGAPC